MKFTYTIPFDRSTDATWEALQDAERLIRLIPGCEDVQPASDEGPTPEGGAPAGEGAAGAAGEAGTEIYNVRVATGLGPIRLRASGTARVRRDPERRQIAADVRLRDPRSGSMYGTMTFAVHPAGAERSEIHLEADVVLASKIGEFAQPILRHKADQTVKEFVRNLTGAATA